MDQIAAIAMLTMHGYTGRKRFPSPLQGMDPVEVITSEKSSHWAGLLWKARSRVVRHQYVDQL